MYDLRSSRHWPWCIVFAVCFVWLVLQSPTLEAYLTNPDHGTQLCQGRQILRGRVPGFDLYTFYGPMCAYVSAAGLWLSGSLLGETVSCALGYSAAVAIIGFLVSRYTSRVAGFVAAGFACLLLARFYKWYVWLFPLMNLLALHGYLQASPPRRGRWALLCGGLLGTGWLFRWDLGTSGLAASLLAIGLIEWQSQVWSLRRILWRQTLLVAAFMTPVSIWFGYLAKLGGSRAITGCLAMLLDGGRGVSRAMAMPLPDFQWRLPLAEPSLLVLAYAMVPATYLLCITVGIWSESRGRPTARSRFLLLVALIGLSTLHQALHRRDPAHLLQVLPLAIIAAHLIVCEFLDSTCMLAPGGARRAARFLAMSYLGLALIAGLGLTRWGRIDLSEGTLLRNGRYKSLVRPLASASQHPALKLVRAIEARTTPDQSILVFPLDSQYFAVLDRGISGTAFAYYPGLFDGPKWRERNMAAIEANMPALVAVRSDFLDPKHEIPDLVTACRNAFPEIARFIRCRYTRVVYSEDGLVLLGRNE